MNSEVTIAAATDQRAPLNWRKGLIALVLSILQPGSGHVYDRRLSLAIAYLVFWPILLLFARITGMCRTFTGLMVFAGVQLGLALFMIGNAFWVGLHWDKTSTPAPMNRWALIAALSLAGLNFAGTVSDFNQDRLLGWHGFVMRADSMAPTLLNGDRILTDMVAYSGNAPKRGDLVVFIANTPGRILWIKRVIGLGGDTVVVSEEGVHVNGQPLHEPYVAAPSPNRGVGENEYGRFPIPKGQYFLMGDNREFSFDSRYPGFGAIDPKRIIGKPLFIYWSPDHSRIGRNLQ